MTQDIYDALIIGAGPAGSVAGAILARKGHRVKVIERERFPRFTIGESLLPQAMVWLDEAGFLPVLEEQNFQVKNGAVFAFGDHLQTIDFREKFSKGPGSTWQVPRDRFDDVLAKEASKFGSEIEFGSSVKAFQSEGDTQRLVIADSEDNERAEYARFVLDASGQGRVLARLLDLDRPSPAPSRTAVFSHVRTDLRDERFDREKILISIHPSQRDIWYWLIPFIDGRASIGAVGPVDMIREQGDNDEKRLSRLVRDSGFMGEVLGELDYLRPITTITGYARRSEKLTGNGFALLGNAAEFLDPIFSSGVTIALRSATLAANLLDRQLQGETVDWQRDYEAPLGVGIETFRAHVEAWYDHSLQDAIFSIQDGSNFVSTMITSVLAGYAWDTENPFVRDSKRYLTMVGTLNR